ADRHLLSFPTRRSSDLVNCPAEMRSQLPRGVRVLTAGAPPAAATIERIEGEFGWSLTHAYGLTETSPFITICEPRPEHLAFDPRSEEHTSELQSLAYLV